MKVQSYAEGRWHEAPGSGRAVFHAVTGAEVAEVSSEGLDFRAMATYARRRGGAALRQMTFQQRGGMLKKAAKALTARKEELYAASKATGATKFDAWVDVDGGIGTFFVYASKAKNDLPDATFLVDGETEVVSKRGSFVGQHIRAARHGVAVHINAFNFPVWGMMEKLAPTLLAGMPAIVKPATVTSYVTELAVKILIESGAFPEGALQLVAGSTGDLLDHLDSQDVVTLTGAASTGQMLRAHPNVVAKSIPFNLEADSLNFCMLGPDVEPGSENFRIFVKEVTDEMRIKTGQRCTAIRRTFVPERRVEAVIDAMKIVLDQHRLGDPDVEGVTMGPLVGRDQRGEVQRAVDELSAGAEVLVGGSDPDLAGDGVDPSAFFPFTVIQAPRSSDAVHRVEAFGPVTSLLTYDDLDDAIAQIQRGEGSLVGTVVTGDGGVARDVTLGVSAFHGRLQILEEHCAKESTGHGSPLPHLLHGGPGRAGGGEELGGIRGMDLYTQRTALQGHPTMLSQIAGEWLPGADRPEATVHPFRQTFDEITIGHTLTTDTRTVTEADIASFAQLTGDHSYAHVDEAAAKTSTFGRRVAHGYFVLSAAAGLFVDPDVGPLLSTYGLENLRFTKPVGIGDTIQAKVTARKKVAQETRKGDRPQGAVEWHVDVTDQDGDLVATYDVLTLVARSTD